MNIRTATKEDLPRILELGREFGHSMLYQKDPGLMERYLPRILVAEEAGIRVIDSGPSGEYHSEKKEVVGYYHYIVHGDPGFVPMLQCYRQFPEDIIDGILGMGVRFSKQICILMQGGSHREVFSEFVKYLQVSYPKLFCYCSIKSQRPKTYEELGFTFSKEEEFTFFNIHKGDMSTYRLGRWSVA